jgi:hypothetical protein
MRCSFITGKAGKLITVRLHTTPAKDFFKMTKFLINKNNIRQSWYTGTDTEEKEEGKICTILLLLLLFVVCVD